MGKQPSVPITRSAPQHLFSISGILTSFLTTALSIPIAFLFSLGLPGDSFAYIVGLVGLGLLTSFDVSLSRSSAIPGSIVAFFALFYGFSHSAIGQGLSQLVSGDWPWMLVAIPPSIGVLTSEVLFSTRSNRKNLKLNLLASVAGGIGLGIGSTTGRLENSPFNSALFVVGAFIMLGFGANLAQMFLLQFLDKFSKNKRYSLTMMPTAFFAYNAMAMFALFVTRDLGLAYIFISSIGFLPALAFTGMGVYSFTQKSSSTPKTKPPPSVFVPTRVGITGDRQVQQGRTQSLKISTESGGEAKDPDTIIATVQTPGGGRDSLILSHLARGRYAGFYSGARPGNYTVQIVATGRDRSVTRESFSFTIQPAPSRSVPSSPPRFVPPPPVMKSQSHPQQTFTPVLRPALQPRPTPAPQAPPLPQSKAGLPRLDSWDPKIWVNREVHGYKVKEHLATGAMGYVLRATFGEAGTEMALKIPILHTGAGAMALEETMSEATRLLELSGQSKYVVQIRGMLVDKLNIQEIAKGDTMLYLQSPPAIVMEFMKGGTSKRLVEDSSYDPLYYSEKWAGVVMLIGSMMATALDTIHSAGFVHLDVKPQNILFNVKPPVTGVEMIDQLQSGSLVPKLADLGSAVKTGGKVVQFTSEYAPVEQVIGSGADPTMDIYALGATLYNLLTKTPVHSKKLIELMNSISNNQGSGKASNDLKSAWNAFNPDFAKVDPKFSSIIPVLKDMMAKDSRRRPEAGALSGTLRNLASKHGASR